MALATAQDERFRVSPDLAQELVDTYGTPLYVVSEANFCDRIQSYLKGFQAAEPNSEITYASKANSTLALISIAHREGCHIDVASEGELRAALSAGVPADHCHLHGNNKQREELVFALAQGIGQIVVDHFGEIEMLGTLGDLGETKLVLRLAPGVDPVTHAKISTGQADTKFGFNIADGSAECATARTLELGLPLVGLHCHVGSQLLDPEAQMSGGELIARFAMEMKEKHGFSATYLNVGGGLGVRYTASDVPMPVEEYCRDIVESIRKGLEGSGMAPRLAQEPGRSLIAEACVTLYKVGVIKTVPAKDGRRTYAVVDGGLSDNPRPALYGSKYTVEAVGRDGEMAKYTVSGKHCETDKLFEDIDLPKDLKEGDVLQVLCTGAYNSSMANNYNRYRRPATALIRLDGSHQLIQRPETWDEMFEREIIPKDLLHRA